jgi:putative aldouronate transport system permease protein
MKFTRQLPLHLMLIPGIILVLIFSYGPMVGIVMAFEKFSIAKGFLNSPWVGLKNYAFIIQLPDFYTVLWNTVFISVMKIIAGLAVPVFFALILNEIGNKLFKRSIQTVVYLPYFLSWVILAGIMIDILSPSNGIVNEALGLFGVKPIFFLGEEKMFPYLLVGSYVWKETGFATIIYLAALTSIDPTLYEAAVVDGANRWKQTWHITLPGLKPIVMLMAALSLGNILNAGFDQVFNLYSPLVYSTGDILDTFVYRMGLIDRQYSYATAVGLFKSVISFILIALSYQLAYKYAGYRIF